MTPIDDLARNLALRSPRGPAAERVARAVAAMSRRRAFQVAAAAGVTSFFTLRTGTAYAACPSCPLAKQLGKLATQSRRHPVTRSKPRPGRVRAKRPHTSQTAGRRTRGAS